MGNETSTYITCPHCGKKVLMDWMCSECKKAIAYDIVDDFVRTNPHKPKTNRAQMGIADEYHIFEFKTEELHKFANKDEALKAFKQLKKENPPGIWQLFCNHEMIDEFIGG